MRRDGALRMSAGVFAALAVGLFVGAPVLSQIKGTEKDPKAPPPGKPAPTPAPIPPKRPPQPDWYNITSPPRPGAPFQQSVRLRIPPGASSGSAVLPVSAPPPIRLEIRTVGIHGTMPRGQNCQADLSLNASGEIFAIEHSVMRTQGERESLHGTQSLLAHHYLANPVRVSVVRDSSEGALDAVFTVSGYLNPN